MPFGVVSGVGRGMGVLDGGPRAPKGRCGFEEVIVLIGLNGVFLN